MTNAAITGGVFNIMATPFAADGSLDLGSLESLVELQIGAGVAGLTILGIMGEAQKLRDQERLDLTRVIVERVRDRAPVVVGVSANGTDAAIWYAREASARGAAAVMATPPANLRNLDAVFEYYRRLSKGSPVPVVVQDEPVSTGVLMPAAFLARLCDELEGCVGIKLEEAPTPAKVTAVRAKLRRAVPIFGGLGGAQFFYELRRGAAGTMTGFAYTEILVAIHRHYLAGDHAAARAVFERYLPLISYEAQPVVGLALRKELLRRRGAIACAATRHPAMMLDADAHVELTDLVERLGLASGVPAGL